MLKIIKYGDERLHSKSENLNKITENDRKDIEEMIETLYSVPNAVGLAAVQVGIMKRIFVLDVDWLKEDNAKRKTQIFINPEIIWEDEEDEAFTEGCLSFPGIEADIYRPIAIRLKYRDIKFEEKIIEADGYLARAIQHELDHVNGVVIIDRIPALKRRLIAGKLNKLKKETNSQNLQKTL